MTEPRTTPDNPATSQINAPWTADQVAALERFQTEGRMHPFTCGGDQHSMAPRMIPSRSGWHCPDPDCSYTQNWAHAFMAQPAAWPKPWPGQQYRLTAAPRDPEVERAAEERAAQAAADSERSAAWLAAQRADTGLRDQYAAAINAKIDGTAGCANGHRPADAVLAVRDREMERMQLLVAASSEPGQAVRMAAQYADRAIENGERAAKAEADHDRVQQAACRTAETLRHAKERIAKDESVVERVRELHQRWDADPGSCAHCHDGYGTPMSYPCPTIRALDQAQPTTNRAADEPAAITPDPNQPAFDAVFAYISSQPTDFLPTTVVERNAMIWHAVHAALQAQPPTCACGEPNTPAVHRTDGPCYVTEPPTTTGDSPC